ncbi:MAG: S8 family serine peptidase [Cyanobacteriota bacterium]|nr:S8 family serine peptidase [Cyanobacteriota bacterium]
MTSDSISEFSGVGVADDNIGVILQRGGEELILYKVSDRFTVCAAPGVKQSELVDRIGIEQYQSISVGSRTRTPLVEFTVAASELETALQAARDLEAVAFASHVYQIREDPETPIYLTNEIVVQFAADVESQAQDEIATTVGLHQLEPIDGVANTYVYQVTKQATENPVKIANRLMRHPGVLTAEPNIIVPTTSHYRPRDPLYPRQWYLHHTGGSQLASNSHISVEQAWDITRGERSVVVAVTDDSVEIDHPDFQGPGKIVAPRDLKDKDYLPLPGRASDNHGTACAGVCVAEENGKGVVGVAPGCALMPIRTSGYLDDESIDKLFDWAIANNASVISCSWGASAVYFPLSLRQRAAITRAATRGRNGKGCIVVFASGNANRPTQGIVNERGWPRNAIAGRTEWLSGFAVHPDVIAVSACTSLNQKAAYSNWGPNISVAAPSNNAPPGMWLQSTGFISTPPEIRQYLPGLGVFTADRLGAAGYDPSDYTSSFGGTSSACPVVAGVAALVLSVNPELTAFQVKKILQETTDKVTDTSADLQLGNQFGTYDRNGHSQWFGYGKVNAYKAVRAAQREYSTTEPVSQRIEGRNDRAYPIPNNNSTGIASRIRVGDSRSVLDVQVEVYVEHEFLGDIEIYLIDPGNRKVLLQGRNLGRQTVLRARYSTGSSPVLKTLLNRSARGDWQLQVIDRVSNDSGTLKGWKLTLGV